MKKVLILMLVFAAVGFAAQIDKDGDVLLTSTFDASKSLVTSISPDGFDIGTKLSAEVIRDLWVGSDFDQDGNKEVMLASYGTGGRVYVYEIDGDNAATLFFDTGDMGGSYTTATRHVAYGDLDGNGMQELLVSVNSSSDVTGGIWAFEYDTVGDSMRAPVQLFKALVTADRWYCENFTVGDVDQDGVQEIFFGNNGTTNATDNFHIASVDTGTTFAENNITTTIEFTHGKTSATFPVGGSPYGGVIADLNGDGMNEVLFAAWDHGAMLIVECDSADSYTAVNYIQTDLDRVDDFAFWDFLPYDLDGDGRDEAYLSMYSGGRLYVTTCPVGTELSAMTTADVHTIDALGSSGGVCTQIGDWDMDGKMEIIASGGGSTLTSHEYQGGDPTLTTSWVKDSLITNASFSGVYGMRFADDLDGDGLPEIYGANTGTTTVAAVAIERPVAVMSLPHYEGFDYTDGDYLGLHVNWTEMNSGDSIVVTSGSLSYDGLAGSTGNKVSFNGSGHDPYLTFEEVTSGPVYASFIFKVTDQSAMTDLTDGGYFAAIADTTWSYDARMWVRPNPTAADTTFDIGFGYVSSSPPTTTGTYNIGDEIFVVMSYNLDDGVVSAWINPSYDDFEAATAPTATLTSTEATPATKLSKFIIRQDSDNETPFMELDELRLGTTWADVTPAVPPIVFFSEYIEGSINNKALEIYNGNDVAVNLAKFSIRGTHNGDADWAYAVFNFPDIELAAGDVYIITNTDAGPEIAALADTALVYDVNKTASFNGDDARAIFWGEHMLDMIGLTDGDPGTDWPVAGGLGATAEYTLVRKSTVTIGNTDWAASEGTDAASSEWVVMPQDMFLYLGSHPHTDFTFPTIGGSVAEESLIQIRYSEEVDSTNALDVANYSVDGSAPTSVTKINSTVYTLDAGTITPNTDVQVIVTNLVDNIGLKTDADTTICQYLTIDITAAADKYFCEWETDLGPASWWGPTGSGSTYGILGTSTFAMSSDAAYQGTQSAKLDIKDDSARDGGWFVREYNSTKDNIAYDSKLYMLVKCDVPDVQIRFVVDDDGSNGDSGYETSRWFDITATGDDWQVISLDLANDPVYGWINGNGAIESTDEVSVSSIQLRCAEDVDAVLYFDILTERPAGTDAVTFNTLPEKFALHQNYPNPFNPTTNIQFDLPKAVDVKLVIYDIMGRKITTLVNTHMEAGYKNIVWNGTNDYGNKISSGIYIYRIIAGNNIKTMKMSYIK